MSNGTPSEAGASDGARRATARGLGLAGAQRHRGGRRGGTCPSSSSCYGGEADLESVRRRVGVPAARLSLWRDEFLAAGEARLKHREEAVKDTRRLKSVVAE